VYVLLYIADSSRCGPQCAWLEIHRCPHLVVRTSSSRGSTPVDRVAGQQAARLRAVTLEPRTSVSRRNAAAQVVERTPDICRSPPDVPRRPPLAYYPKTPHGSAPRAVTVSGSEK